LALNVDVLLEVFKIDTLLHLVLVASVQHFNLTKHLIQKFVLNLLEDRCVDELSRPLFAILLLKSVVFIKPGDINVLHLEDLAARALLLSHPLAILVSDLELAEEAYDLIAIVALFGLDGDLLAHHARGLLDEVLLELVHWHVGVPWQQDLDLK
jgi:hypothetical protein